VHGLVPEPSVAEPLIALLLLHGADPEQRNAAGLTPAQQLEQRGADEVADLLELSSGAGSRSE
jgi:hypothetical protein